MTNPKPASGEGDIELRHEIWESLPTCTTVICSWPNICNICRRSISHIMSLISAATAEARIETLENLKLYNGAYIGIDGKRVDNMVSHAFIDERIAELQSELARLEKEGEARTGLSCNGNVLRPSRQQSHRAS